MRTGNQLDGMYFLLLFVPILFSIWGADLSRKKIVHYLLADLCWSQNFSTAVGVSVQGIIMVTGVLAGYLLTILI